MKIDFGIYINADDITVLLKQGKFSFDAYEIQFLREPFLNFAEGSGLLTEDLTREVLAKSFIVRKNHFLLKKQGNLPKTAQLLARYLREIMLEKKRRFSFETVFSHESNLDIMRRAAESGYKVYLYFVSTESPEINKYRVKLRVSQNGHDVPEELIVPRYYRSLNLLYEAAEIAYQCFFFDNSGETYTLVNHFKVIGGKKVWDTRSKKYFTAWFKKYYWKKNK